MSEPACSADRRDGYARRQPELTALHRTLSAHWPAFLERANEAGGLPKFVTDEVQAYLRCGLLEHGHALLVCERCGKSRLVGFSCKRRGFCPSCCGRRMNDVALHLTQRVIPEVPVRQWVCSLPWQLRYVLGYDRQLCAAVLGAFVLDQTSKANETRLSMVRAPAACVRSRRREALCTSARQAGPSARTRSRHRSATLRSWLRAPGRAPPWRTGSGRRRAPSNSGQLRGERGFVFDRLVARSGDRGHGTAGLRGSRRVASESRSAARSLRPEHVVFER